MYYTKFRIQNFKGIQDTTVNLSARAKAGVFAFVGLNESGKTTILEAIHSFSPDNTTGLLVGGQGRSGVPIEERVPRHLLSNFTGDVSVSASVRINGAEKDELAEIITEEHELVLDVEAIPDEITIERHQQFKNGDFVESYFSLRTPFSVKKKRQKKWRKPTKQEREWIRDAIYNMAPDIAYFPTFVFDFPNRIFLTRGRGGRVNNFYRQVFQDILDFDGKGLTIEESIVRRIRSDEKKVAWLDFWSLWSKADDKEKVQHVMDRASATVSDVVFGRWDKIFGEDAKGKEINISYEVIEGEVQEPTGAMKKTDEHDIFVKFQVRDGTRRFDINDRSLGFRWFFSFMLFTQFRTARDSSRPTLFLFDEPAANLHAAAQQKLLDSFPGIAKDDHVLAYSTHSHYMIDPRWLEQTFIVTNRADAPSDSVVDTLSLSDESLDIRATLYRDFVSKHPNQVSYFQPILDRLEVVPSRFDLTRSSVIVEGKSDYYVLRYAAQLVGMQELPIVPALGAGTLGALIGLHLGWGLRTLILLDGDKKGADEKARYTSELIVSSSSIKTLTELNGGLKDIEDLLDSEARTIIAEKLGITGNLSKKQIMRFFQESLASDEVEELGDNFRNVAKDLLSEISAAMDKL